MLRKLFIVLGILLLANAASARDLSQMSEDELVAVLTAYPDEDERLEAAKWLAVRIKRPTPEQTRQLLSSVKSDQSPAVRGEVANTIAKIGRQKIYRIGTRRLPFELRLILTGFREACLYEQVPLVRMQIVEAAAEYDHLEVQVILNLGKGDIHPRVRAASYEAERRRDLRLREQGNGVARPVQQFCPECGLRF